MGIIPDGGIRDGGILHGGNPNGRFLNGGKHIIKCNKVFISVLFVSMCVCHVMSVLLVYRDESTSNQPVYKR